MTNNLQMIKFSMKLEFENFCQYVRFFRLYVRFSDMLECLNLKGNDSCLFNSIIVNVMKSMNKYIELYRILHNKLYTLGNRKGLIKYILNI